LKKRLYGRYGVEEFWIVDPESRSVTVFGLNDGAFEELTFASNNQEIQSRVLVDLHLKVEKLFNI